MHNAEVYMLLVRPSKVPVLGESVTMPFLGQIELGFWTWNLHNEEERKKQSKRDEAWGKKASKLIKAESASVRHRHAREDFQSKLDDLLSNRSGLDPEELKSQARGLTKDYERQQQLISKPEEPDDEPDLRQEEIDEAERNRNFEFKFSKRVDIATTQMLNSMKAGDVFPSATITIIQRPVLTGTSLVLNFMKLRLLEYRVRAEVYDTMTHMYEDWTCEFHSMAYAYKNNSATHDGKNVGQKVAQSLSQGAGSVRAFAMQNLLPF